MGAPRTELNRRFELRQRLGAGAFGTVWEAWDRQREMVVALKLLSEQRRESLLRFKNEFRAIAGLQLPHLVTLFELFADDGGWFFTMERVFGPPFGRGAPAQPQGFESQVRRLDPTTFGSTARSRLEEERSAEPLAGCEGEPRARLPETDETQLRNSLRELATGVQALHQVGLVHCDLKPSNVLVDVARGVRILDFGLVAHAQAGEQGSFVGTPAYASPEQLLGASPAPSHDWYAVGVMLYEALTGRLPFTGSLEQLRLQKQQTAAIAPRALGAECSEELASLCCALLERDPGRRASMKTVLDALGWGGLRLSRVERDRLVGREEELSVLLQAQRASSRELVVSVVSGPSGIGKSALLRHFAGLAEAEGAVVLSARSTQRETIPFKALDAAIDDLARVLEQANEIPPEVRSPAVQRLFPAFGRFGGDQECEGPVEQGDAFDAVAGLLAWVAARWGLTLVLDDLQWADPDSLALLESVLARDLTGLHLVVGERRAGTEPSRAVAKLASASWRFLELGPLSRGESRLLLETLLESRLVSAEAERIAELTGGHPFFIGEVAQLSARGSLAQPRTAADAVRARSELLTTVERDVLLLCALCGEPVEPRVLTRASARDSMEVSLATESLLSAGMLREALDLAGAVEAAHDQVREVLVGDLLPERRRSLHEALAEAYTTVGAAEERPEALAHHLAEAGRKAEAAQHALRAAWAATRALAFDRAADLFQQVLELPSLETKLRLELLAARAEALSKAGRGPEAADAYLSLARRAATRDDRQRARERAASQLVMSGNLERGYEVIGDLLVEAGHSVPENTVGAVAQLARRRLELKRRGLRWRAVESVDPVAARHVDSLRGIAFGLGMADNLRAAAYQARSLRLALDLGDPGRVASGLAAEAIFRGSMNAKARRRARLLVVDARRAATLAATPEADAWVEAAEAVLDALEGVPGVAPRLKAVEARFQGEAAGTFWARSSLLLIRFLTLRLNGEFNELRIEAPRAIADAHRRGDLYLETSVRRGGAMIQLVDDEPAGVREHLAAASWPGFRNGFHIQHWLELEALCELALYEGRGPEAYQQHAARFRQVHRSLLPRLQRLRVLIHGMQGRLLLARAAAGVRSWQSCHRAIWHAWRLEAEDVRYALPRAALLRAGAAALAGRADDSLRWLRRAYVLAGQQGHGLTRATAAWHLHRVSGERHLAAEAQSWLDAQRVRCPERLMQLEAPGLVLTKP